MRVDVVIYRKDTGDAIATYGADAPTWRTCVSDILSWLRIEVLPYWINSIWMAPCAGTDPHAALALYGIGLAYGIVSAEAHGWLPVRVVEP